MLKNYRRYQRYSVSARAIITQRNEGAPESLTAQVNTISQGGMGFYASKEFRKAVPVTIEFLEDALKVMGVLDGRIASICSLGNDYFVGIAFDSDIPHERFVTISG